MVVALALTGLTALASPARAAAPRAAGAPPEVTLKAGLNDPKDPNIAVDEFLPESIKVATGTTVTWEIAGPEPHSVTFVPPGSPAPNVETDDSLTFPTPPTGPYDGTTLVNSGVLPLGAATTVQKFSMSFSKPGDVHLLLRAAPEHDRQAAGDQGHPGFAAGDHQGRERADEEVPGRGRSRQEEARDGNAQEDEELRRLHDLQRRDGHLDRAHRRARVLADAAQR